MDKLKFVNVKMGTNSTMELSHGNTLPFTQMPHGMISFCPQTKNIKGREGWFYNPKTKDIEGIRLTHQPSPWIGDYGTVLFTPQAGKIRNNYEDIKSTFIKCELKPHYLCVDFKKSNAKFELTPTERCAAVRVSYKNANNNVLSLFPVKGNYEYEIKEKENMVFFSTDGHSNDDSKNFHMFCVIKFKADVDFKNISGLFNSEKAYIHIPVKEKKLEFRLGISYISFEMAELSLERECGKGSFSEIRKKAERKWEKVLNKIEIETKSTKTEKTFYSCMYRTFLFPHKAYELDKDKKPVHFSPSTGETKEGVRYTDNGFWDTYRTVYPLYSLIAKKEYAKIVEGFVNDYYESGWLPRWTSLGETGCMPSTLVDAVIADACSKKIITKKLAKKALTGMIHHAETKSDNRRYGRAGIDEYIKLGFVPYDKYDESVNLTLDSSYCDWCVSKVAEYVGDKEAKEKYEKRSKNYLNIFDKETYFMKSKDSHGNYRENFNPFVWGYDYTESGAYQNIFGAPHALNDMISLMGKEKTESKIDEIFRTPPAFEVGRYGCVIHEMKEMENANFGQCAISNQPSFSIPFLYCLVGKTEKSSKIVKRICKELFNPSENGYPGDEDNGSMSAWYIFATIGMYPICPGKDEYIKTKKLVKSYLLNK